MSPFKQSYKVVGVAARETHVCFVRNRGRSKTIMIGVFEEGCGEELFAKSSSPDLLFKKEVSSCSVLRI